MDTDKALRWLAKQDCEEADRCLELIEDLYAEADEIDMFWTGVLSAYLGIERVLH